MLLAVLVVSTLVSVTGPAAADCAGPRIRYEASEVAPGDQVTVVGELWGDNCYDTGPPPDGEGVLGVPADDIELVFVQGADRIVVARGAADDEYAFSVDVTIPVGASPGPASLQSREGVGAGQPALTVTEGPAEPGPATDAVVFDGSEVVEIPTGSTEAPVGTTAVPDLAVDSVPIESDALPAPDRTDRNVAVGLAVLAGFGAALAAGVFVRRRRLAS